MQAESSNFASLLFDQGFQSAPIAIHEKNLKTADILVLLFAQQQLLTVSYSVDTSLDTHLTVFSKQNANNGQ